MINLSVNLEEGARGFPIVSGFRVYFCASPSCGPHFVLLDRDDQAFAEFVMTAEQIVVVERMSLEHLAGIPKKSV